MLAETGSGGANSVGATQYIWLPTPQGPQPVAAIINGSRYAVHADHLNTPRRLSNEQGQPVWQWPYSAFGEEPAAALSDVRFNLRYPGQYHDRESGLHYNYFRSYDSRSGRYTQPDPIGLEGGWNRFAYVDGNPLGNLDMFGLATVSGGTQAQRQNYEQLLKTLKQKIEEATCKCPDKARQLLALFDKWAITISSKPMPTDSDGFNRGRTEGRDITTVFYSDTAPSVELLAHEFFHLTPQNVNKMEAGGAYGALPHPLRPWEMDAIDLSALLTRGGDICSMLTGESLKLNPVHEYYRNYDYRPFWKRWLNIK